MSAGAAKVGRQASQQDQPCNLEVREFKGPAERSQSCDIGTGDARLPPGAETLIATDPTTLGDDLLDPVLADIVEVSRDGARRPEFWVRRIAQSSQELRAGALAGLAAQGMVEADESGFFFLSRRASQSRRRVAARSQLVDETRSRILDVIFTDAIPDSRDIVIIGLAHACDIFRSILSPDEYEAALPRIQLISRLELLSSRLSMGFAT